MIDFLDEALRDFVTSELPLRSGEIDITFEQPRREWSSRLSRPTINFFLRDLRENGKLRGTQPTFSSNTNGDRVNLQRAAIYVDIRYMATVWASDPLDEHRILSRLLLCLLRTRAIPVSFMTKYWAAYDGDIQLQVAQADGIMSPSDIWSVLDNEMRPHIELMATVRVNPYDVTELPVVRTRMFELKQMAAAEPTGGDSSRTK